jgi:phosphatidylserine decarboxylase
LAEAELPVFLRGVNIFYNTDTYHSLEPIYRIFAKIFHCNLEECLHPLEEYKSFAEFFSRDIDATQRPISTSTLVSPADGIILHVGEVTQSTLETVKGMTFSLKQFYGDNGI